VLIVPGRNCSYCSIEIIDNGALQILGLETFASPSTGCCGMVAEATADTIVGASASKQSVDFLCCGLGSA
jgi:hypothetical protein